MTDRNRVHPVFKPFIEAARRHLGFLARDYRFEEGAPLVSPPGAASGYRSGDIEITAHYEYGSAPWIGISLRRPGAGRQETSLAALLGEKQKDPEAAIPGDDVEASLRHQAQGLRSLMPKLIKEPASAMKAAVVRDTKRLRKEALATLSVLEKSLPSDLLSESDVAFLRSVRRALAKVYPAPLQELLTDRQQLKHKFSPALRRNKNAARLLAELVTSIQDYMA